MARMIRLATVFLASLTFLVLPTERDILNAPSALAVASGATNVSPLNFNFDAPSYTNGTPPTNHNLETGALTPWDVVQGTATIESGGPSGSTYYAKVNNLSWLRSAAFTVPSNAQTLSFDRSATGGSSAIVVKVAPGPAYDTWEQAYIESGITTWSTKSFNVTKWQGQSIKLRFESTSSTGIDNAAVSSVVHPSWSTWITGTAFTNVPELHGDGPSGNYSKLGNSEKLWTSPFTVPANGTTQAEVRRTYFAGSSGLAIYVLTAPDYTAPGTRKYLESSATTKPWEIKSNSVEGAFSLSSWAGQKIKLRIEATGTVGVDDVVMNFTSNAADPNKPKAMAGDPVDTTSGAFTHSHTDIAIPGRGVPLEFTRSYSSTSMLNGPLGHRWTHNYAWSFRLESDSDATITYASGSTARFDWSSGSQTFTAPAGSSDALVRTGSSPNYTYTLTTKSQIKFEFTGSTPVLSAIKDRNNNTTSLTYTSGLLTSVTDPGGRSLTFSYDVSNRIYRVTDPLPSPNTRTVEFTYDGNGDLWKVKDVKADPTNGPFTVYTYSSHRMTSLTDANGHVASQNTYDDANRVAEQLDALNNRTCFYYGTAYATTTNCSGVSPTPAEGETVMVNPRGKKTTYGFDTTFRTTYITDHDGGITSFAYDSNSNRTSVTDPRSKVMSYTHDSKGNVLTGTNPLRQPVSTAESGSQCNLAGLTNGTGNGIDDDGDTRVDDGCPSFKFEYTTVNDVDLEIDALGRQTDYIYDSGGNLTRAARKSPSAVVKSLTCFKLDSYGQVTETVQSTNLTIPSNPADDCTGNKTLMSYDTYGNMTCTINARFTGSTTCASGSGKKATFIYDLGGRLLYSTNELTNNSKPVAGAAPEIGSQCGTDGLGNGTNEDSSDDSTADDGCPSTKYTYDAHNNVTTLTDALANVTTNAYDAKGNLTSVKDANRKTAGATAESGTSQCGADGTGDGENDDTSDDSVIDDGCLSVAYRYDNGDRLEKVIQAAVSTTSIPTLTYGYDANGNRTAVTNPKRQAVGAAESGTQCGTAGTGNDTDEDSDSTKDDGCPSMKHAFDNLDRLESSTDALARTTSYQHDAASNLTQRTDARGLITKYIPDDANRLDSIEHRLADNTLVDTVDYTYDAVGFRTQMVDPTGTTSYVPDDLNRVDNVTFPGSKVVDYQYDDLPGGSAADYPGQRTKLIYPDTNKFAEYTYLADGRMSTVTDWLTKQTSYTYDDAGRLTRTQLPNGVYTHDKYDAADRLTCVLNDKTATAPVGCTSGTIISKFEYTLDSNGNRTQMVDTNGTNSYQLDALYRLTQVTYPSPISGTDTYSYDANGNRLTKNSTNYTYDAGDQMLTVGGTNQGYDNNGNQTARGADSFTYDHENRLTGSVIGGVADTSVYSGDGLRTSYTYLGVTRNFTWDVARDLPMVLEDGVYTYVYGLDLISATNGTGTQTYLAYDGLGSTVDLADGSGTVFYSYWYDVFGSIRHQSGSGPSNDWRFTGEWRDWGSGLYHMRARHYDTGSGRFLSQDPAKFGHPYAYVEGNPVNLVDPNGEWPGCPPKVCGAVKDLIQKGGGVAGDALKQGYNGAETLTAIAACTARHRTPLTCNIEHLIMALSGGPPAVPKEGGIRILNKCTGLCADILNAAGKSAFVVGHTIFSLVELTSPQQEDLLRHELVHVDQYELLGDTFLLDYFGAGVGAFVACGGASLNRRGFQGMDCLHDRNFFELWAEAAK